MRVLINGATGRMGMELENAIEKQEDIKTVCGFGIEEKDNVKFPIYNKIENIKEEVDVIIDFSNPIATFKILEYAIKHKIPTVIATTGFSEEELKKIEEISKEIPIFKSSNMSVDINLMAELAQKVAEVLKESDIEIVETHHNRKIDAPSGTAILLADAINKAFNGNKKYVFDRMQKREARNEKSHVLLLFYMQHFLMSAVFFCRVQAAQRALERHFRPMHVYVLPLAVKQCFRPLLGCFCPLDVDVFRLFRRRRNDGNRVIAHFQKSGSYAQAMALPAYIVHKRPDIQRRDERRMIGHNAQIAVQGPHEDEFHIFV